MIAAALKLLTKEPDTTPVNITEEKPLRVRRRREGGRGDRRRRDDRPRRSRDDRKGDRRDSRRRDDRRSDRPRADRKPRHQSEGFKPYFKD